MAFSVPIFNSPFIRRNTSVTSVMLKVLAALIPAIAAYVWQFGIGILIQIGLTSLTAVIAEGFILKIRAKPVKLYLTDLSALVTAWLIALSFPPTSPWWLTVSATLFAIIFVKHLYGGLGQNIFNPAMAAYCAMIVAYPQLMAQWPGVAQIDSASQLNLIFGGERIVDAITSATPLDELRTILRQHQVMPSGATELSLDAWQWISAAYFVGGLYLLWQRIISWHIPIAFCTGLIILALSMHWIDNTHYASAWFHLINGATILGAFFILTDPVSAATTPRGKILYGLFAAVIVWLIRTFGAYPDGVAFATLLANLCVPLLDLKTQPAVFGHKTKSFD